MVESKIDGWVIKTQEELDAVRELRKRLEPVAHLCTSDSLNMNDDCLIRFCRARKLKLDLAEALFQKALEWRQRERPEEKAEKYSRPDFLHQLYPLGW